MKKNIKILFTLLIAFTIMLPFGVVRALESGYSITASPKSASNSPGNSTEKSLQWQ